MDTAAIIAALLTGIAGLVVAVATAKSAATKDQVEALCKIIEALQEEDERKTKVIARLQEQFGRAKRRVEQLVAELRRHGIAVPAEEGD